MRTDIYKLAGQWYLRVFLLGEDHEQRFNSRREAKLYLKMVKRVLKLPDGDLVVANILKTVA